MRLPRVRIYPLSAFIIHENVSFVKIKTKRISAEAEIRFVCLKYSIIAYFAISAIWSTNSLMVRMALFAFFLL